MSLKTENSRRVAKSRPVCMGLYECKKSSWEPQNESISKWFFKDFLIHSIIDSIFDMKIRVDTTKNCTTV
jgi:hypothetical protein